MDTNWHGGFITCHISFNRCCRVSNIYYFEYVMILLKKWVICDKIKI